MGENGTDWKKHSLLHYFCSIWSTFFNFVYFLLLFSELRRVLSHCKGSLTRDFWIPVMTSLGEMSSVVTKRPRTYRPRLFFLGFFVPYVRSLAWTYLKYNLAIGGWRKWNIRNTTFPHHHPPPNPTHLTTNRTVWIYIHSVYTKKIFLFIPVHADEQLQYCEAGRTRNKGYLYMYLGYNDLNSLMVQIRK
jgi:hypothetical protein